MRGLVVRIAKGINRLLFRKGTLWADRWHGRDLAGPRQVRNALVYVLQNSKKHGPSDDPALSPLDPLSSAQWFLGFVGGVPRGFRSVGPPSVAPAQSWLLRVGWQRRGRIDVTESPAVARW